MSKRKYRKGKMIKSVADFSKSGCKYFIVYFGSKPRTIHRSFLASWQYMLLERFICNKHIYEADLIREECNG